MEVAKKKRYSGVKQQPPQPKTIDYSLLYHCSGLFYFNVLFIINGTQIFSEFSLYFIVLIFDWTWMKRKTIFCFLFFFLSFCIYISWAGSENVWQTLDKTTLNTGIYLLYLALFYILFNLELQRRDKSSSWRMLPVSVRDTELMVRAWVFFSSVTAGVPFLWDWFLLYDKLMCMSRWKCPIKYFQEKSGISIYSCHTDAVQPPL